MEMVLIWLISAAVSVLIAFYLIRGAVMSAMRETLDQYTAPRELLQELSEIRKYLTMRENREQELKRQEPKQQEETQPPPNLNKGEAYLIKGTGDYDWKCSNCGAEQRNNRFICLKCGEKFAACGDQLT